MVFWKRVHWFFNSECNERCKFCFRPHFGSGSKRDYEILTEKLVEGGVKEVVYTGGEPLLSKSLETSLEILRGTGIDTSIHTNATLLTPDRINRLVPLVDEIAIPLDSTKRETQEYLRNEDCLPQIKKVFEQLQEQDVRIGVHTVATALNINHIPKIYDFLREKRFNYWRVYEFNPDLVADRFTSVSRFREVEKLGGAGATESDGGVTCLRADFLLMEEQMSKQKDKRVQFVGVNDYDRQPYFFLDASGNAYLSVWFSQGRKPIGNILNEGFTKVKNRAIEEYAKGPELDEDAFIETEQNQPLWVRAAWEGNYFWEEFEDLNPRYYERFTRLINLHLTRMKGQGSAPRDARLDVFDYTEFNPVRRNL